MADLAQRCCPKGCTENNLTIARVRKQLRMDNANRSSTERRDFARMLIRSMVKPVTENVPPQRLSRDASFSFLIPFSWRREKPTVAEKVRMQGHAAPHRRTMNSSLGTVERRPPPAGAM